MTEQQTVAIIAAIILIPVLSETFNSKSPELVRLVTDDTAIKEAIDAAKTIYKLST